MNQEKPTIKEYKALVEGATDAPWYGFDASFSREKMVAFSVISNDESGANIATGADYEFVIASRNIALSLIRVIELADDAIVQLLKSHDNQSEQWANEALSEIRKLKGE